MRNETAAAGSSAASSSASDWIDYATWRRGRHSTVVGDVRVLPVLPAPMLGGRGREILVLLPDGALESGRRYPVLYMHDGQNIFDAETSFAGEWGVDETMAALQPEGIEAIVVGIPNGGPYRFAEYTPFATTEGRKGTERHGAASGRPAAGEGAAYLRFLVECVKPAVDAAFPTRPEAAATGVMGSSLGALISLWALCVRPDVFGFAGGMSPAFPPGQDALLPLIERLRQDGRRIYIDAGAREGSMHWTDRLGHRWSAAFVRDVRRIREAALRAGFREPMNLRYVEEPDAIHHESAWARRLPEALRFLLGPLSEGDHRAS